MSRLLGKQMFKHWAVRSVLGLRATRFQASCLTSNTPTAGEIRSRRPFSMLQQGVRKSGITPVHICRRNMGRMKDIMSGVTTISESPAEDTKEHDPHYVKDNTVKLMKNAQTRSDELTVLIDGEHITLPVDQLYTQIRCMNHEQILSMVGNSYTMLNAIDNAIPLAFRRLYFVCKKMDKEEFGLIMAHLPKNEQFQILCAMVTRQAPSLDPDTALDMLSYLTFFGVKTNSPAVKTYLQLAMNFINDLQLDEIALLSHSVHTLKTSDAIKILREGLKILAKHFQVKDLRSLDLWRKIVLFETLGAHMKDDFKQALLRSTASDSQELKMGTAVSLLNALAVNNHRDLELEHICLEYISLRVDKMEVADAKAFLDACTALHIYAQEMIASIAESACKKDSKWTFDDKVFLAKHLRIQGHISRRLLDTVFAELADNVEGMGLDTGGDLICYLSDARHDVQKKETLLALAEHIAKLPLDQRNTESLVDLALGLDYLQVTVPKKIINLISKYHNTESSEDSPRLVLPDKILCLSHLLDKPAVVVKVREAVQSLPRQESSMKGVFDYIDKTVTGIGVKHNQYSESGHFVDHMVELKTGSEETKKIAVLIFPENSFTRNTGQLKCIPYIVCKAIQNDGQLTVVFNAKNWARIEERDRLEYLLQKLQRAEDHQDLVMIGLDNLG